MKNTFKFTSPFQFVVLALLCFSIIFIEWKQFPVLSSLFDLGVLTLLGFWLWQSFKARQWLISKNVLTQPLLALGLTAILSGVLAHDHIGWAGGLAAVWLAVLMVHIFSVHLIKKGQILLILDLWLWGGLLMALIGIYQWLMFQGLVSSFGFLGELALKGKGIYITTLINDVSRTGAYWSFVGPLALARVFFPLPYEKIWQRVLNALICLIVLTVIILGGLKSPLLVVALTGIFLVVKSKKWLIAVIVLILLIGIAMKVPNITVGRFMTFLTPSYYQRHDDRPVLQTNAVKAWLKHGFLFGTGINNHGADRYGKNLQGPHNVFLVILGETGILGLLAFLWLLKQFFTALPRGTGENATIRFAAGSMMAGGMLGGLSYHVLTGPPTINLFWMLIVLAMGVSQMPGKRS